MFYFQFTATPWGVNDAYYCGYNSALLLMHHVKSVNTDVFGHLGAAETSCKHNTDA